jgi:hypothetical protein
MHVILPWPGQPVLSIFVLWLASVVFLWAAREPMRALLTNLGGSLRDGLDALARACSGAAAELRKRSRAVLLAAGKLEAQGVLEREFQRIDASFSDQLGQYSKIHRRLDDLLHEIEADYQRCGEAPPELPGWTAAVEALSRIPTPGDPNVQKVLESIRKSSRDAERKALQDWRGDTARRHKVLSAMAPAWKDVRALMTRMRDGVTKVLESTRRIHGYAEEYEKVRRDQEVAARTLTYSAVKLFVVALTVLAIALGGAFVNFQLIALPMSELVPAGSRVGGVPVAKVAALVIVLMETALGIFAIDMLGITDLFPKLRGMNAERRRLILGIALAGLFFLASVESSLAVLRERIVEADSALKLSLAGEEGRLLARASSSAIPVVGQAVLGFVLPWVLAMVAVPLEMLLDSARHVLASLLVVALQVVGGLARAAARVADALTRMLTQLYDVYVGIPLRIERALHERDFGPEVAVGTAPPAAERRREVTAS